MEIRPAEPTDRERIRAIASASFQSSYALSPQQIETVMEAAFTDQQLTESLDADDERLYLAETEVEGQRKVNGFIQATAGDDWTIRWLHVDPEARGMGIGTALFEEVLNEVPAETSGLGAWVFEAAVEGGEFCDQFGLNQTGTDRIAFGSETLAVDKFADSGEPTEPNDPSVAVPDEVSVDGTDRPLNHEEPIPGRDAPFFPIYTDDERDEPYGYFCSECGSTDVSMDSLERLECGNCGNVHAADEWDDAYL